MTSKSDVPQSEQEIEAEVLLRVAQEMTRMANEATERARAAWARIPKPMPLLDGLVSSGGDENGGNKR